MVATLEMAGLLIFFGALGALVKELVDDNTVDLPRLRSGKLYLGVFGSMLVGAAVGYIVDNSPITAFLAGFAGLHAIAKLLPPTGGSAVSILNTPPNKR